MEARIAAQIRLCLERAEHCEGLAKKQNIERNREELLKCALHWRQLAYSYQFGLTRLVQE